MASEPSVDPREVYSLLDDEYARQILIETYEATVYRRLERLREQDLVETVQEVDPDSGPQQVYAARLNRVSVDLTATGFEVSVDYVEETAADRLTRLYEELSG